MGSVLPATRHKQTRTSITPANQASTWLTYPRRMEGWVDLGSLITARPGIELTTAWSQVRCPNCYVTESHYLVKHQNLQTALTEGMAAQTKAQNRNWRERAGNWPQNTSHTTHLHYTKTTFTATFVWAVWSLKFHSQEPTNILQGSEASNRWRNF